MNKKISLNFDHSFFIHHFFIFFFFEVISEMDPSGRCSGSKAALLPFKVFGFTLEKWADLEIGRFQC